MCEIVLLIVLWQSLGNTIRAKSRDPIFYQFALIVCWFGGEVSGALVGFALGGGLRPGGDHSAAGLLAVGGAFLGAACGAGFVFMLAGNLKSRRVSSTGSSSPKFVFPPSFAPETPALPTGPFSSMPGTIRFYCPQGHLLEEPAVAAGQQRQCPFCRCLCIVPQ